MIRNKLFKTYFDIYDTDGTFHGGFIQNFDLTAYVDFTMLNDLSAAILDAYVYNELSKRVVLDHWKKFLRWSEERKRFEIVPRFYTDATNALYVYLATKQKFFEVLETDFRSLSAQETETVNFGSKTTGRVYGEKAKTNVFDKVVVELSKGTETENRATHTDTETRGAHSDTETRDAYTDSESIGTHTDSETRGAHTDNESKGAQTNSNTRTEKVFPFDAAAFVNDTQTEESGTNGAQSNSMAYGAQSNSTQYGAQSNSTQYGEQEKTTAYGSQSNSTQYGAQENTRSFGKTTTETKTRTDTQTDGAHTDNETISAHIDTRTRTKVILLSPEKYFEIQKELSDKNVYTLFKQAIDECFLNDCFFQALEKYDCIGGFV